MNFKPKRRFPLAAPGDRIYAVGDIHGRLDLFRLLLRRMEEHDAQLPAAKSLHIVLLGDLVDRGPDPAGVLRAMERLRRDPKFIVLRGNHEEMMIGALSGRPGIMRAWIRAGGDATIRSFGLPLPASMEEEAALRTRLLEVIPPATLDWLRNLPTTARSGDYFFCHAGIRPGIPVNRQRPADLMWIREDFLGDTSDHGVVVVHGHSVSEDVEVRPNRIGIDTGAYRTGKLACLYLEGATQQIMDVTEQENPQRGERSPDADFAMGSR
jgi:serine/threonine protein phosphatase 1